MHEFLSHHPILLTNFDIVQEHQNLQVNTFVGMLDIQQIMMIDILFDVRPLTGGSKNL